MNDHEEKDWVDSIADVAAALGFNRVRIRWKLDRMRRRIGETVVQTKGKASHVGYEHKVCPYCHSVNDRAANVCARCERPLSARSVQLLDRIGILSPTWWSVSTVLGVAMVIIYARLIIDAGGGFDTVFSMNNATLFRFGASFSGAYHNGEWWRLLTAVFLHAGLWHLGFNLFALSQLGPFVEEIFGRSRMLLFFVFTGIVASLGSLLLRSLFAVVIGALPDGSVAIGASGAIMGLMGIMAGWGHRDGTSTGRHARNFAFKWAAYTMVFGWIIGADNGAHGAGFVAGGLIGLVVNPLRLKAASPSSIATVGAAISGILAAGAVVACLIPMPSPLAAPFDRMMAQFEENPPAATEEDDICYQRRVGNKEQERILLLVGWSPHLLASEAEMQAFTAALCSRHQP